MAGPSAASMGPNIKALRELAQAAANRDAQFYRFASSHIEYQSKVLAEIRDLLKAQQQRP